MVSPQLVLLIILTMQSYKFYLNKQTNKQTNIRGNTTVSKQQPNKPEQTNEQTDQPQL